MSMKALGRSSARRGLAPSLKAEADPIKILLVTLYRGFAFEDVMTKYSSMADSFLAPSLSKVLYPIVTYFVFHIYLAYVAAFAIYKEIYEKTVIGHYASAFFGRFADQYNAWQESRIPRVILPPIRVQIDEKDKLQSASLASTESAAAAAAAEVGEKTNALRSSPNTSPRALTTSVSNSSIASSDSASGSSSLSSLTTTSTSNGDNSDDDESDASPLPFNEDPPLRSSRESSDNSSFLSAHAVTPDFSTPPQSPFKISQLPDDKKSDKEDGVGTRSDPVETMQVPIPIPARIPEKKVKKDKKEKKAEGPQSENEEDEMTGQKEGDDSEKAATRRMQKMERRLKKERESLRKIREKKKMKDEGSLKKIIEEKSKESGKESAPPSIKKGSKSSSKRKKASAKNLFAKKVANADSIRHMRDKDSKRDKKRDSGSKKDKKESSRKKLLEKMKKKKD